MKSYNVQLTFTEDVLASSPCNPEVYKEFIASRKRDEAQESQEEVDTLTADAQEKIGWSVFHADEQGIFLFDYKLRGFLKEAAAAITGKALSAYKSKIDRWVFVSPRRLYLRRDGQFIKQADGVNERPIRMMTMQGPRTSVKRSDILKAGCSLQAVISVLPLGQKEITEDVLRAWLKYGELQGLGEWRNGSYGRFEANLSDGAQLQGE